MNMKYSFHGLMPLLLFVIVVSLSACSPGLKESKMTNPEVTALQDAISRQQRAIAEVQQSTGQDVDIEKKLSIARLYFQLDTAIARAEGNSEGNFPFFFPSENSSVCALLIHGFGASPYEALPLGEYLSKKGISVYGVRLAGHGASTQQLKDSTKEDWYKSLDNGKDALGSFCKKIFLGGISYGAMVALKASAEWPVDGVIVIGAPMIFLDPKISKAKYFRYFIAGIARNLSIEEEPFYSHEFPTAAVAQMAASVEEVKNVLPQIKSPALILQSLEDARVKPESAIILNASLSSTFKRVIFYPNGTHILLRSDAEQKALEDVFQFIVEIAGKDLGVK